MAGLTLPDQAEDPHSSPSDASTSLASVTNATLTVRVIKSFAYRTAKNLVLHHVDLPRTSAGMLKTRVRTEVTSAAGWKAYHNVRLDTLKIYTQPQGTKTANLIINLDADDDLMMMDDGKPLASYGCRHETELSFFNEKDYQEFRANPKQKW